MALLALPPSLSRSYSQVVPEPRISGALGLEKLSLCSRLDFLSFKGSLDVCQCGSRPALSCSNPRRESPQAASISSWGQKSSRLARNLGAPARAIKINRGSATLNKEEEKQEEDEGDTELCPVECVREFTSRSEFDGILEYAKEQNALVVVDFFKTACGSCRYIEKGFTKLCKGTGDTDVSVIFLKHNVMDEYEEQSEVAESFKIRVVPLFHFYKDGKLVESFPTREKTKILEAICKHTGLDLEDFSIPRGV